RRLPRPPAEPPQRERGDPPARRRVSRARRGRDRGLHPLVGARRDPQAAAEEDRSRGDVSGSGGPLGLIAGNGRFPFLVAQGMRKAGRRVVAVAIKEEASPELAGEVDEIHWVGLGQLGRCIEALQQGGAREAVMAGQVKHRQIFSDVVPDLKLVAVLPRLALTNTDSLIGAVAHALGREGIALLASTAFVEDQMATAGAMTRRTPSRAERQEIAYGRKVARTLASLDLGQTAVVKDKAAVALEAM